MPDTHLYLVRHGEADGTDTENPGLSANGREQAKHLMSRLTDLPPCEILHSPQRRAAETAQLLGRQLGTSVVESELLRDRTPFPEKDEWHRYPAHYHDWLQATPPHERDPGGHELDEAIGHLSKSQKHLLLITHAFVIGWFIRDALDAPSWRWLGLQPQNCSISIVSYGRQKRLLAFNQQ